MRTSSSARQLDFPHAVFLKRPSDRTQRPCAMLPILEMTAILFMRATSLAAPGRLIPERIGCGADPVACVDTQRRR